MTIYKYRLRKAALLAFTGAALLGNAAHAADVHVLATGALHAAFEALGPGFEKATGNHLVISWGPSYGTSPDALPMRIKNGEAMDVCFMIGAALDGQIQQGNFIANTRTDIAESRVGVAVKAGVTKPDISTVDNLRKALLAAKTVAFSEGASGTYITGTLFTNLGVAEQMKPKSILIKGKELVGNALARGDAELGLQQISELRAISGIQYVGPLPKEIQKVSVISAAIGKGAKERQAAASLIAYLKTPAAAEKFEQTGLDPIQSK